MADLWDAEGDLVDVLDGLEPLSLVRHGCRTIYWTRDSWRFSETRREVDQSNGLVIHNDVEWHIPIDDSGDAPDVGDLLVDSDKNTMTVVGTERLRAATRYRCLSRQARLDPRRLERFDVEQPQIESTPEGPVVAGWTVVRPAVQACLLERHDDTASAEPLLEILTVEAIDAGAGYRWRGHRGVLYEQTAVSSYDRFEGVQRFAVTVSDS